MQNTKNQARTYYEKIFFIFFIIFNNLNFAKSSNKILKDLYSDSTKTSFVIGFTGNALSTNKFFNILLFNLNVWYHASKAGELNYIQNMPSNFVFSKKSKFSRAHYVWSSIKGATLGHLSGWIFFKLTGFNLFNQLIK